MNSVATQTTDADVSDSAMTVPDNNKNVAQVEASEVRNEEAVSASGDAINENSKTTGSSPEDKASKNDLQTRSSGRTKRQKRKN